MNVDSPRTQESCTPEPSRRRLGRRALRRRRFTACVATFLVPLMVVDPQSVDAMFNEAMAYQAMTAAGIAQVGPTGNATVASVSSSHPPSSVGVGHTAYDDNGNLHQRFEQGELAATYSFDAENRLVAYTPTTGDAATSASSLTPPSSVGVGHTAYDADGIRNSRTVAGVTTWHLTDKNRPYAQVLTETDAATGALRVRYTYGDDLISQTRPDPADPHGNPPVTRYYLYDGQMSTRQLTDAAAGAATAVTDTSVSSLSPPSSVGVGHTAYDAYGNLIASTGTTANAYRYTGEQFDDAIGQYYLRARYYDQAAGRFASRDTYAGQTQDPVSLHKYLYASADPANRVDPSGLLALYIQTLAVIAMRAVHFAIRVWPTIKFGLAVWDAYTIYRILHTGFTQGWSVVPTSDWIQLGLATAGLVGIAPGSKLLAKTLLRFLLKIPITRALRSYEQAKIYIGGFCKIEEVTHAIDSARGPALVLKQAYINGVLP